VTPFLKSVLITGDALVYSRPTASANRAMDIAHGFRANGYSPTFFDMRAEGRVSTFGGSPVVQPPPDTPRGSSAHVLNALMNHIANRPYDVVFLLRSSVDLVQTLSAMPRRFVVVYDLVEDPLGVLMNLPWRPYSPSFWRELTASIRETLAWYRGGWTGPDVVTVISANLGKLALRVVPEAATAYLPILSSPRSSPVAMEARTAINRCAISCCGSVSFAKDGISTLLKAMTMLKARRLPVHLDMFGHGLRSEQLRLEIALKMRRLGDTVKWWGFVAPEQLQAHLASAGALVLCKSDSRQNRFNFATRLVDYLSVARPCIISRVGETAAYFRNGDNALVFEAGDCRTLAGHIEWLVYHPQEADEIGRRGHRLLSEVFDAKQRIAALLPILRERGRTRTDNSPESDWIRPELIARTDGLR